MIVRVRFGATCRTGVRLAADLLILVGIASMLIGGWALTEGALYQHVQNARFARMTGADESRANASVEAAPALPRPFFSWPISQDPGLWGRLDIPAIGLSVMVRDDVDAASLRRAVGHLPSSARPGQPGNFVLLGHRDTFFRPLRDIARGDAIHMRTIEGDFTYIVDTISVVSPDSVLLADPSSGSISTLITCFPFTYTGPAPRRLVVRARLMERMADPVHIE